MVTNNSVHVHFIELVKTTELEHYENEFMDELFPFYPSYKAGDQILLQMTIVGNPDAVMKKTPFKIVDVVHSVRQSEQKFHKLSEYKTYVRLDVYLRKME